MLLPGDLSTATVRIDFHRTAASSANIIHDQLYLLFVVFTFLTENCFRTLLLFTRSLPGQQPKFVSLASHLPENAERLWIAMYADLSFCKFKLSSFWQSSSFGCFLHSFYIFFRFVGRISISKISFQIFEASPSQLKTKLYHSLRVSQTIYS